MLKRLLFCVVILCIVLAGCQGSKDEIGSDKTVKNEDVQGGKNQSASVEKDILDKNQDSKEMQEDVNSIEGELTPAPMEYIKFEPDEKWNELSGSEYAVQIDDTLYLPGITAKEFISLLESSAIDYMYDYNGSAILTGGEEFNVCVYRDGKDWFTAIIRNIYTDETKEMNDLPVVKFVPSDEALEFCYFIDGRSYEDILKMTYSDVKEMAEEVFSLKLLEISKELNGKKYTRLVIKEGLCFSVDEEHTFRDTSYAYCFYIEKGKSVISSFEQGETSGMSMLLYTPPAPEPILSFSELTEEERNLLEEDALATFKAYGNYDAEILAVYLIKEDETSSDYPNTTSYYCVASARRRSGRVYVRYILKEVGRRKDGTLSYKVDTVPYGDQYCSYGEFLDNLSQALNVLDSRIYYEAQ